MSGLEGIIGKIEERLLQAHSGIAGYAQAHAGIGPESLSRSLYGASFVAIGFSAASSDNIYSTFIKGGVAYLIAFSEIIRSHKNPKRSIMPVLIFGAGMESMAETVLYAYEGISSGDAQFYRVALSKFSLGIGCFAFASAYLVDYVSRRATD